MMKTAMPLCPNCGSSDPRTAALNCLDSWHRDADIAAPARVSVAPHQELSDDEVERATLETLRAAYRSLRDHHIAETRALVSRQIVKSNENLVKNVRHDDAGDLILEPARVVDTRDHSGSGYTACDRSHAAPPCVDPACYCETHAHRADRILPGLGDFVRRGVLDPDLWIEVGDETLPALHAIRVADPTDPWTTDYLSDQELAAWAERAHIYQPTMKETYIRFILDELRERRDAEVLFVELDRKFQDVVDCAGCHDGGPDGCGKHEALIRSWRNARSALCDLARVHRGYLMSLNAPSEGDPR